MHDTAYWISLVPCWIAYFLISSLLHKIFKVQFVRSKGFAYAEAAATFFLLDAILTHSLTNIKVVFVGIASVLIGYFVGIIRGLQIQKNKKTQSS